MGLIGETAGVFAFLRDMFDCIPTAIRILVLTTFSYTIYIAIMKNFRG